MILSSSLPTYHFDDCLLHFHITGSKKKKGCEFVTLNINEYFELTLEIILLHVYIITFSASSQQVVWCSNNFLDFCLEGVWYKSWLGHG
jgi:hypothetical protein